ncbi:MAG: DUF1446 domain-containing protein [Lachnospiraceae bacterium]|nr:DUF1446 domain-containing protein [Lachnospiraceae bacterium]
MKKEFRILSPNGILGYGFPEESFNIGVAQKPDLIAVDAGSTDPGPYYLGSGQPFTSRSSTKRDLEFLLKAALDLNIPLVIGSAGGSGANPHLERDREVLHEIAKEQGYSFKVAIVPTELDKNYVAEEFRKGNVVSLDGAPEITERDILDTVHIVAQMGLEPIVKALDEGAQVVLCGRAYDPSSFAAPAVRLGYDEALATHLGKILECACIAAVPGSASDVMMGYLYEDSFAVEPCSPKRKCTVTSVCAHTLYEKANPYILPGPGGTLDLSECTFEQETERRVRVRGSKFIPQVKKNVKLEGTKLMGYRTISICGNRDPFFLMALDDVLEGVKAQAEDNFKSKNIDYKLDFIVYGRDGVMGALEPEPGVISGTKEVGIVIDVVADTQEHADTVCGAARAMMLHYGYPGRVATAGNLAFPFSPSDAHMGAVYNFSAYCLLENEHPEDLFKCTVYEIIDGEPENTEPARLSRMKGGLNEKTS